MFSPACEITEEGGVWTIKTATTLKTMQLQFKVRIRSHYNPNQKYTFITSVNPVLFMCSNVITINSKNHQTFLLCLGGGYN